jgi:general secretion pathway protein G
MYEVDNGFYPPTLQSLITKGSEPNWKGPYLRKAELPIDPWQNAFIYTVSDSDYKLSSAGPDGAPGTADDITN